MAKTFCQSEFWEKKFETKSLIESFVFDSKGNIYIGVENKGVYKSTDNGKTWVNKSNGLTLDRINCLAVNSNDEIFCGVSYNGHLIKGPDPLGVFRSTNYGDSWQLVYETIWVNSIVIDSEDNIYTCGNSFNLITDVVFSEDNGNTWEKIEVGLPEKYITEMIMDEKGNLYIERFEGGLYKSTNKGKSWFLINNDFKDKLFSKIISNFNGFLFAKIDSIGLFKSIDEGKTWAKIDYAGDLNSINYFIPNKAGDIYLLSDDNGLQYLENNKSKWEIIFPNIKGRTIYTFKFDKDGYIFACMMIENEEIFNLTPLGYELYKSKRLIK